MGKIGVKDKILIKNLKQIQDGNRRNC